MTEPRAIGASPEPPNEDETPYRVAFEKGLEAIVIVQDGVVRVANPAARRLSGYSREEILGKGLLDLVHPEDQNVVQERYQRRLNGDEAERSLTLRVRRKDGELLWLESHSMPVDWEGRPAVLVFFADVTDQVRFQQLSERRERMFQRVAEVSPHFIFIYDYDENRDVYINRSVAAALGYSAEQEAALQPYPFARLCHPEDFDRAMDREHRWHDVPDRSVDVVEFRLRAENGEWRWMRSLNTPFLRDARGRVKQILGVSEDVTEVKHNEEALRRSEKLASLAVLAGGLAHDFGNLLTPVLGHAELLLERLPEGSPLGRHAEAIRSAAEHASELVEQLLVYAGRRPMDRRAVNLNELALEIADLHRPVVRRDIEIVVETDPAIPPISGDPSQIRQALLNLVTNALESFGERGGRIALRLSSRTLDASDVARLDFAAEFSPGRVAVLEVQDDGVGMDAATRARLWEPFFTTKPRGRGLGLASTLGILRRHAAGLAVDSRAGGGTTFRVYFPVESPPRIADSRVPGLLP